MAKGRQVSPDRDRARQLLDELWAEVLGDEATTATDAVKSLVNSEQTAIRFCLPTQLLGKLTDNSLDALCLQRGNGSGGRWDPRGFATRVVVPWNRENQNVLGPSGDPYVSNPLRRPRVDFGLDQMGEREQWEALGAVLRGAQEIGDESHTRKILRDVMIAIRDRLRDMAFAYVLPERVSLIQAEGLVEEFLSERSGGDRGLAVAAALFETVRVHLHLYSEVRRSVINAADAATKSAGDLECIGEDGAVVLAVEVKERRIGDDDVHIAVAKAREFSVNELIFCCQGVIGTEQAAVEQTFLNTWASGTNLYQVTIAGLMRGILPILGERGVKTFVEKIGRQLDAFSTQPRHRRAWKSVLDGL